MSSSQPQAPGPQPDPWDEEADAPLWGAPSDPRRARLWWLVGGVLVVVMVAFIGWAVTTDYRNKAVWRDLRNETVDEHTFRAEFDVTRPPDRTVVCTVRAMAADLSTVGSMQVTIPPGGPDTVVHRVTVRTTTRAVGGGVRECVLQ